MANPCTREFLRILAWELNSLNKELFLGDDKHSSFLKIKGRMEAINKMMDTIEFLGREQPQEEENEKEDA